MGDWNSLDAIKQKQAENAELATAMDSGGWIEERTGPSLRHHVAVFGLLAAAVCVFQNRAYLQRLGNRWWNGCAPAFPTGDRRQAVPAVRNPLLPPTVQLKVKRVGGEPAVLGANLDDTVQELISRIETQLDVAVQNLLFAGEILTLFRSQSLAEGNVRDGSTLVYTVRQQRQDPDAGGLAGRARDLMEEMSSGSSVVSRVAGPAQLAAPPSGPKATRCSFCNSKLPPLASALQCRCEGFFCEVHRPPRAHECTYDPQQAARRRLRGSLREQSLSVLGVNSMGYHIKCCTIPPNFGFKTREKLKQLQCGADSRRGRRCASCGRQQRRALRSGLFHRPPRARAEQSHWPCGRLGYFILVWTERSMEPVVVEAG